MQYLRIIDQIHSDCHQLCFNAFGAYFGVSGNIGVFCQTDDEYEKFTRIRMELTHPSDNPDQKYYLLKEPIIVSEKDDIPSATYTYLYIRQPDPTPYGKHSGDVDFILTEKEYEELKKQVKTNPLSGVQMYDRPGWDTIQITDPTIKSVAYISTMEMAEKARVKFD